MTGPQKLQELPSAAAPGADVHAIAASMSLQELQPRRLKHGDTFAVLDRNGDAIPGEGGPEGLYHRDTRHLSRLELRLAGARPLLLSSASSEDGMVLTCDLTNPDLFEAGRPMLAHDQLQLRRTSFLRDATHHERVGIRNFADRPVCLRVELRFEADFADLFEVRGERRARRGEMHPPEVGAEHVVLAYTGLDGRRRATRLQFDPQPAELGPDRAVFALEVPAGGQASFCFIARCENGGATAPPVRPRVAFLSQLRADRREHRAAEAAGVAIETSDAVLDEMLRRSVWDLRMLSTETPEGPFPYAGIPWFSTTFGRDALITALLTLWLDPALALGVLRHLAALQARETDPAADAEPGKILHEARRGEMAELGEVPFRRYYGSVDSTPLFVMLAGAYLDRTGDLAALRALWPHIEAALGWMEAHGDRDGNGFLEYFRMTEAGLANQGWKDSHDSVFHADGRLAEGPVALCEVQAYAYAAFRAAARIARALGQEAGCAAALEAKAERLRERFEAAFWCEEIGTYALALDGAKRPCRVRSSNAGHALFCGIASPERAAAVARQLMGSAMHSGWGIRTIAAGEARYNPISYHNGSVWPHDNALIALGLARYGHHAEAGRVLEGLAAVAAWMELRRLPELFCGFRRRPEQAPTAYPVACAPQAWAAAAPLGVLAACLGLGFDPAMRTVRLDRPVLPSSLDRVALRGLSLGEARIDLRLQRMPDGSVAMGVTGRRGDIRAALIA